MRLRDRLVICFVGSVLLFVLVFFASVAEIRVERDIKDLQDESEYRMGNLAEIQKYYKVRHTHR